MRQRRALRREYGCRCLANRVTKEPTIRSTCHLNPEPTVYHLIVRLLAYWEKDLEGRRKHPVRQLEGELVTPRGQLSRARSRWRETETNAGRTFSGSPPPASGNRSSVEGETPDRFPRCALHTFQ